MTNRRLAIIIAASGLILGLIGFFVLLGTTASSGEVRALSTKIDSLAVNQMRNGKKIDRIEAIGLTQLDTTLAMAGTLREVRATTKAIQTTVNANSTALKAVQQRVENMSAGFERANQAVLRNQKVRQRDGDQHKLEGEKAAAYLNVRLPEKE